MSTFGEDLLHYAETAHSVSHGDYIANLELIRRHLESTNFGVIFFAIVVHEMVSRQPHLVSEFPIEPKWWEALIKENSQFKGQTALGYSLGKPIWIVGSEKQDLKIADSYLDLLGHAKPEEIPPYVQINDVAHAKTSVIFPLMQGWRVFGVMNVESKLYVRANDTTLQELSRIAKAICVLRHTKESTDQIDRRTNALRERLLKGNYSPALGDLQLFLASPDPDRAENDVLGEINNSLSAFRAHVDKFDWTQPGTGDIKRIIWKNLSNSRFAICYLSERASGGAFNYQDNPNVLIECGMLYALRESRQSSIQNFVIVREKDSPPSPFDLNSEYMLIVPRNDGELNRPGFRDKLDGHILALLRSIESESFGANI